MAPDNTKVDGLLFCVTPVTFVPITALTNTEPVLVPEFVTVPVLFTLVPDNVMPLVVAPLFFKIKLPLPPTPPDTVNNAVLLFCKVVPPLATVSAVVEIVRGDVLLFSITLVTLEPTPPVIVVVPAPLPVLVTVPALLIALVKNVSEVDVVSAMVKLFVPVTPPLKATVAILPVLPTVNVPVVLEAKMIALL